MSVRGSATGSTMSRLDDLVGAATSPDDNTSEKEDQKPSDTPFRPDRIRDHDLEARSLNQPIDRNCNKLTAFFGEKLRKKERRLLVTMNLHPATEIPFSIMCAEKGKK